MDKVFEQKCLCLVWSSVSQPVCRDAQVCRGIFLGVPPNLRTPQQPCKNRTIFSIFWYYLNSSKQIVSRAEKG